MKKIIALLLIFVICTSGNRLDRQADEVAEKLDGVWEKNWTAEIGQMTFAYAFSSVNGNAGRVEFYYIWDNDVMHHYYGTFDVSIQEDGIINIYYLAEIDSDGNIERLAKIREETLVYAFENGNLVFRENNEDSRSYFKIED